MKIKKSAILALALSMSFVVTNTALAAEENPDGALETTSVSEKSIGGGKGLQELEPETSEEVTTTLEDKEGIDDEAELEEDEEVTDDEAELETSEDEEPVAQRAEEPTGDQGQCLSSDETKKEFSDVIDPMFEKVGSRPGVYEGSYDKKTKEVTVKILNGEQGAKEISGTGLAAGLKKLYDENNLVKIKVGSQDEKDLKSLAESAPSMGMDTMQMFKFIFGADILNEVQKETKTGTLKDFVGKRVELKLTIQKPGCDPETISYFINGVSDNEHVPDVCPVPKVVEEEFSKVIDPMFDGIKKKDGVYEGTYDNKKREVTVTILDETQKATELRGTGLAAGFTKLYRENGLVKIQIGDGEVIDLKEIEKELPENMSLEQFFALSVGAGVLSEAQKTGDKTGTLKDFIDKEVTLKLTVVKPGCLDEQTIEYKIIGKGKKDDGGGKGNETTNPDQKPQPKPSNDDDDDFDFDFFFPDYVGAMEDSDDETTDKENDTDKDKLESKENEDEKDTENKVTPKEDNKKEKDNEEGSEKDHNEENKAVRNTKKQNEAPSRSRNPKTGVASLGYLAGISAISMAGIVASRKKEGK